MIRLEVIREPSAERRAAGIESAANGRRSLTETDRKIKQTIAYMLEHLNQPLQVARLAALANISPSHFFALFKQQTGCAPIDFFIRLRMQHACQLLEGTSLNVKEVAAALGYDDPFYFSRTFKSVNHVAPTEYRLMSGELKHSVRRAALPTMLSRANELSLDAKPRLSIHTLEPAAGSGTRTTAGFTPELTENQRWNGRLHDEKHTVAPAAKENFCHAK